MRDSVCDLESRLQRAKDNVEEIQRCMRAWAGPVFGRKDGKRDTLLSLEDRAERLDRFYALVRSSGEKIHFLLKVGKKKKNICLRHMSDGLRVSSTFHHSARLLCSQQFLICFESFTVI